MSNFNQNEDLFNESLLNLYDEQFKYSAFKTLISKKNREAKKLMNNIFESISQDDNDDVKFIVDLSDEMKEKYKQGLLKFDKGKDGKLYAQLRDENNRYGKKLNIKEDIKESDLIFASQLDMITDVLNEIVNTLENVEKCIHNVLLDLHNDRVGLYYSGLALYLEALQASDDSLKNVLIAQSLKSLNDAQAQIIQEFKADIYYLKSPEFLKSKKKKHNVLVEKMQNIPECYQTINRIISLKAMIYFDNNQLSSMMMVCTEYQRFIAAVVVPVVKVVEKKGGLLAKEVAGKSMDVVINVVKKKI